MSTSLARSETKITESTTDSCHSEPTVTRASSLSGQESSVCGSQLTKQADASHLRTVTNPARRHGLGLGERTNPEQILTGRCDRTRSGGLPQREAPLQKLLVLVKGMPHF